MGWIGNALIIAGAWQLGHKHRWAFLLIMCGGACWITQGCITKQVDLAFIETVMFAVNFRNFLKWGQERA